MTPISDPTLPYPAPIWRIGLTGGIGSGKSYLCHRLEASGFRVFYCDDEAKRIIRTDPAVRQELQAIVGSHLYDADGKLVKSVLAGWLCRGREWAARVDAVVHPRVAEAFVRLSSELAERQPQPSTPSPECQRLHQLLEKRPAPHVPTAITLSDLAALPPSRTLIMECALLFESGFDRLVDHSVLVHVSHDTQVARVMARDGVTREQAEAWMGLQMSEEEKLRRADAMIAND